MSTACRVDALAIDADRCNRLRGGFVRTAIVARSDGAMEQAMWGSILSEWLSLIFRWLHVVAAVAWIGSSFYFIALDLSLRPRVGLPDGVAARPGRSMAAAFTGS